MNCNKKFAWLFVAILAITVLLVSSPTWAQQAPPSTHKAKIEGTITLEPGVVSAAAGQAAPAYVLKKDERGRWVYVRNEEGASALGVPGESASALAEELNRARRHASAFAKHVKDAEGAADAIAEALGEQDSRLDAHKGRLDGLDKAVADAKKLAQQGVSAMSRSNWAFAFSGLATVIALIALIAAMRRGPQAQEPEDKISFISREPALTPAPKADESAPSATQVAPTPAAGRRGKGGGDQPAAAPPVAPPAPTVGPTVAEGTAAAAGGKATAK